MNIQLHYCLPGARMARGLTVVIDVYRAATTACHAIHAGSSEVLPVGPLKTAYGLKEEHPDWLLMGEREGVRQPGFDLGNSPSEIIGTDLAGKTIIHTTSAGTQGIAEASAAGAEEILLAGFVNAGATARYIAMRAPESVSLLCMGSGGRSRSGEDDMCGIYIKNAVEGFPNAYPALEKYLRTIPAAQPFLDPDATHAPREDLDLCLELDRFDFVLRAETNGQGLLCLRKNRAPNP